MFRFYPNMGLFPLAQAIGLIVLYISRHPNVPFRVDGHAGTETCVGCADFALG